MLFFFIGGPLSFRTILFLIPFGPTRFFLLLPPPSFLPFGFGVRFSIEAYPCRTHPFVHFSSLTLFFAAYWSLCLNFPIGGTFFFFPVLSPPPPFRVPFPTGDPPACTAPSHEGTFVIWNPPPTPLFQEAIAPFSSAP